MKQYLPLANTNRVYIIQII